MLFLRRRAGRADGCRSAFGRRGLLRFFRRRCGGGGSFTALLELAGFRLDGTILVDASATLTFLPWHLSRGRLLRRHARRKRGEAPCLYTLIGANHTSLIKSASRWSSAARSARAAIFICRATSSGSSVPIAAAAGAGEPRMPSPRKIAAAAFASPLRAAAAGVP